MSIGSLLRPVARLLGAVMLGVGTLFQPKARADDHWSASPRVRSTADEESETAGGPGPSGPKGQSTRPRGGLLGR